MPSSSNDAKVTTSVPVREGWIHWLGEGIDYAWAMELQRDLAKQRADGEIGETLLFLGHAPVYTAGRRSLPEHILSELDAPLIETDRGGQVTYHGPGQLVGYPIVSLADLGIGPKRYVLALEQALIAGLAESGVEAHCEEGLTGVWTSAGKIAAIGVRVSRGVATHGFALNIYTDLTAYASIVPCGIEDRPMTSMSELLRAPLDMARVAHAVADALGAELGVEWRWR